MCPGIAVEVGDIIPEVGMAVGVGVVPAGICVTEGCGADSCFEPTKVPRTAPSMMTRMSRATAPAMIHIVLLEGRQLRQLRQLRQFSFLYSAGVTAPERSPASISLAKKPFSRTGSSLPCRVCVRFGLYMLSNLGNAVSPE